LNDFGKEFFGLGKCWWYVVQFCEFCGFWGDVAFHEISLLHGINEKMTDLTDLTDNKNS